MTALLFLAVVVLGVLLRDTRARLSRLEQQASASSPKQSEAGNQAPSYLPAPDAPDTTTVRPPADAQPAGRRTDRPPLLRQRGTGGSRRFEDVVGKRLPIWIGGIALACAAFFLVRYSIELGLFGPAARSLLAASFGAMLLALAEFGARLPKIGRSFAADPRLAQSLAGTAVATLYGTLYMSVELYRLIGLAAGFACVVAVTALALYLARRHGPSTALLGLAGGYLAPYVAGLPESSLTATIVYLATFGAGLLALSLARGWTWLAWSMSGASLVWTVSLLAIAEADDRLAVGLLILGVAVGVGAVLARDARRVGPLPLALPLAAGAVQLAVLSALADFSPLAWALVFAIAVAAMVLARTATEMFVAVWASLLVSAAAVGGSFLDNDDFTASLLLPPAVLAALFGGAGQVFAFTSTDGRRWAWLAILAPALMLAASAAFVAAPTRSLGWGLACIAAAVPALVIAARAVPAGEPATAQLGLAVASATAVAAVGFLLPPTLHPSGFAALYAATRWRHPALPAFRREISLTLLALLALAMLVGAGDLARIPLQALAGQAWHYAAVPPLGSLALALILPGAALVVLDLRRPRAAAPVRAPVPALGAGLGCIALGAFAYAVAKQPLAIADEQAFIRWGFVERAVLTHGLVATGWLLLRHAPWPSSHGKIGAAVLAVALLRLVWFDLLVLNPVLVPQALPGGPLLNAGTLHASGLAAWAAVLARQAGRNGWPPRMVAAAVIASFLMTIVAVLITVRQAVHGAIVAQPGVTRAENYFYSAGLLLLALAWLGGGIARALPQARIAGLALLTLVTVKVFLVDAASLQGLLRVLSFLGLGAALIGIGWAYSRVSPSPAPS